MKEIKLLNYLLLCFLVFVLTNCESTQKYSFKISELDSTISPTKISISALANDYRTYQGRYIETTGIFYGAFEQFAICTEKNSITGRSKCFWLRTNRHLEINFEAYEK